MHLDWGCLCTRRCDGVAAGGDAVHGRQHVPAVFGVLGVFYADRVCHVVCRVRASAEYDEHNAHEHARSGV